jgi:phytoene synthase
MPDDVAPGSLRHFAVLFSGFPEQPMIEALYAFETEVRRLLAATSHEAAHAKLQWWRAEIDRLVAGRPSHPRARALLPLRDRRDVDLTLLHEMLVAADLDLARMTYSTWQELDAYLFRSAGTTQTLIAAVLVGERGLTPAEREFARRVGAASRQCTMLFELDRDLARGRLYAPTAALEAAGIDPEAFVRDRRTKSASTFVAAWQGRVLSELRSLPAILHEPALRGRQRHGLVLAALHERWLETRSAAAAPAGAPRPELGPFTRLWTAWRTALRHG